MSVLKIKRFGENSFLPTQGTKNSAGFDLYACGGNDVFIFPNSIQVIHTGISMEIPEGCVGLIYPRSSLGIKENLVLANGTGVIDSDYRGEIMVALYNYSDTMRVIEPGERIAQIVFTKYEQMEIEEVSSLSETDRGSGGFGSTGKF